MQLLPPSPAAPKPCCAHVAWLGAANTPDSSAVRPEPHPEHINYYQLLNPFNAYALNPTPTHHTHIHTHTPKYSQCRHTHPHCRFDAGAVHADSQPVLLPVALTATLLHPNSQVACTPLPWRISRPRNAAAHHNQGWPGGRPRASWVALGLIARSSIAASLRMRC